MVSFFFSFLSGAQPKPDVIISPAQWQDDVQYFKKLASVLSQDENKWFDMSTGAYLLTKPEVLVTLGIVPDYDHASFTLIDENNKEIILDLTPIKGDPNTAWVSASKTQPLFRQNQNNPFWFTYLEDIQAVFLSFKKYDDLNRNSDKLFDFIEEKKATRLIVDLRFNGGVRFQERPQAIAFADQIKSTDQSKGKFICDHRQENFFSGVTCCCEA